MNQSATLEKFMTRMPHTIGVEQSLEKAEEFMREYRVRHLPVLHGGKLVGILSDRDIKMVETFKDVDPTTVTVEEAYTPDPFIVKTDANFAETCEIMANKRYSCVLVVEEEKLVGIFTWVDALRSMGQMLNS